MRDLKGSRTSKRAIDEFEFSELAIQEIRRTGGRKQTHCTAGAPAGHSDVRTRRRSQRGYDNRAPAIAARRHANRVESPLDCLHRPRRRMRPLLSGASERASERAGDASRRVASRRVAPRRTHTPPPCTRTVTGEVGKSRVNGAPLAHCTPGTPCTRRDTRRLCSRARSLRR